MSRLNESYHIHESRPRMKESCQIDESNICNMAGVQLREFKEYDELVEELFNAVSSVLQCVAVCCSVLQCVAVCCRVLQYAAVCCSVSQFVVR